MANSSDNAASSSTPSLVVKKIADQPEFLSAASSGTITRDALEENESPEEILGNESFSRIVLLSLADCDTIDSSGVSWLIRFHQRCARDSGKLIIHSVPPMIERTLRLLHMEQLFSLAENEAAARKLANAGA